jgi:CheY-like chemotaxis protein
VRQHHPDLIVMDIQLPGISGIEVTKWIKDNQTLPGSEDINFSLTISRWTGQIES